MAQTLPVPVGAAVRRDLHRHRRRRKARARERRGRRLRVADEMPDMVEKNLLAQRQLAVGFGHLRHFEPSKLILCLTILQDIIGPDD